MAEILKRLELDLTGVPNDKKDAAKRDALNVIENETTRALSKGRSPVKGEIFQKLDKEYADAQKQGDKTPNLQFEGDMLGAIEYNIGSGDSVEWGYSAKNPEAEKADGHNQFSAKSKKPIWANGNPKLPKRRFIPDSNQDLKPSTMKLVNEAISKHKRATPTIETKPVGETEIVQAEFVGGIFSDENIMSELVREFERGNR